MDYPLRIFLTLNNIFVSLANWYIFQFKQYAAEAVCFEVWKYSSTAFHPFRCTHIFLAALSHHQHHRRQNHHHHHYHHHHHQLSDGALCISCKSGHQVVPFALLHCLGLPYWHHQLLLSWFFIQQPDSHQSKKVLETKDRVCPLRFSSPPPSLPFLLTIFTPMIWSNLLESFLQFADGFLSRKY